jgi:plasmid maintenance system antidote protein VapI
VENAEMAQQKFDDLSARQVAELLGVTREVVVELVP